MVSIESNDNRYNRNNNILYGLSTDNKPTDSFEGIPLKNGMKFIEMDTKNTLYYDESTGSWV